MSFVNHKNNARGSLYASISASATSLTLGSGQGALFPTSNFKTTLKQFSSGVLTKQEIVLVGSRTGDVFSGITRACEACPVDDASNTQVQTATAFSAYIDDNNGTQVFLYITAGTLDAIHTELERLETDKLDADASILTDAVTKSGTQTITGPKTIQAQDFIHDRYDIGGRITNHARKTKNNSNNGGVKWNIYTDADNAIVGNRKRSLRGYLLKWADGALGGFEEFITTEFDTYDGNTTYTKRILLNASTKITELYDIIKKTISTNTASVFFKIGSRFEISGITHASFGHFTQFLWGNIGDNPEGSGNDGGWGLFFGSWGNPYLKFEAETTKIGRSGGTLDIPTTLITHGGGYLRRNAEDVESLAGSSTTTCISPKQVKDRSKVQVQNFSRSTTGTQSFTHNLGRIPSNIKIYAKGGWTTTGNAIYNISQSEGNRDGTNNRCVTLTYDGSNRGSSTQNYAVYIRNGNPALLGVVQNVTSSGFDISWTELFSGNPTTVNGIIEIS